MNNNYYKSGSYNVKCDICSQKYKRDTCRKNWQGLLTCSNCYEPRHPVTLPLPVIIDSKSIPDARPRATVDIYVAAPGGLSVWGVKYMGVQGLDPNLTWNTWTETWDGNANPDSFIIGT